MAAKRILLLDGPFVTAHHWANGHIQLEGEFKHEPAGLEALAAYLKKHRTSLFYLLADIAEEGFQLEDLPYVQGADRKALLQRRLGQYFYNTPLSAAISLGRAPAGRRDEKFLFAALPRIEAFTPWLDTLRDAESLLAGVYSVPLVLGKCVPQLLGEEGPLLFVSLSRGGVRQTFFEHGKLHFSRLSQLATRSIEEVGRSIAGESIKISQYLIAQRQVPRGEALRTTILAHAEQIPALQDFCRNSADLHFEFMELAATARRHGLKDVPPDSNADTLLLHYLASKTPAQQFAPAGQRRWYRLWQIRFALTSAAWIVSAGCLLFAGKEILTVHGLRDAIERTQALTAADDQRYHSILDGLPKVTLAPDNLRALIARLDALQQRTPAIGPLLHHLSQALDETPRVELTRLAWHVSEHPDAGQKPTGNATQSRPLRPGSTAGRRAVVEIQAQLPLSVSSDQRAQFELIEGFADRLRTAQTDVQVLSRPFDIESDKPLKSSGEIGEPQPADAPKFSLRIARQLPEIRQGMR